MNITCPLGWTRQSELSHLSECDVPLLGVLILKIAVIGVASVVFFSELLLLACRYSHVMKKGIPTRILLFWSMLQNLPIISRPALGLGLGIVPETSLWLAFITHISAALAAGIVILFLYIQIKLLAKSAMGKTNWLYSNKKKILIVLGTLQAVLFVVGPLISYFLPVTLYIMFWIPVIVVVFTVIPYFCTLGIIIYHKISNMQNNAGGGRRLLVLVFLCTGLSLFTGVVGIYLLIVNTYEWALFELCWLSDAVFNAIFFTIFIRTKSRK